MANYGTEAGVAALAQRSTNSGAFDVTTNPTLSNVTSWLAQLTSMMNVALATGGFVTPVTDAAITPALDGFINAMAADLVHAANSTGRFFSERALENGVSPIRAVNADIRAWVEQNSDGLTALGLAIDTDADISVTMERSDIWPDNTTLPENRFYFGGLE